MPITHPLLPAGLLLVPVQTNIIINFCAIWWCQWWSSWLYHHHCYIITSPDHDEDSPWRVNVWLRVEPTAVADSHSSSDEHLRFQFHHLFSLLLNTTTLMVMKMMTFPTMTKLNTLSATNWFLRICRVIARLCFSHLKICSWKYNVYGISCYLPFFLSVCLCICLFLCFRICRECDLFSNEVIAVRKHSSLVIIAHPSLWLSEHESIKATIMIVKR